MDKETQKLFKLNQIDNKRKMLKPKGLITGGECIATRCTVKDENALLKEKVEVMQRDFLEIKKELEFYREQLQKDLSPKENEELTVRAIKSKQVQVQHKMVIDLKAANKNLHDTLVQLRKEYDDYREEQDSILTSYEADRKIQEKVKLIRSLREKRDQLLVRNEQLELDIEKANLQYSQLADSYNTSLTEYKMLRKRIDQLKMIEKKGFKLEPIRNGFIKKKRKWPIRIAIARN